MKVTTQGVVKGYEIRETVIRSQHRLTYADAQTLLDGGNSDHPIAADVVLAGRLARTLTKRRMRRGSVDFDLPEIRVLLDDKGHPTDIIRKDRKPANRLIEELMLLANRVVARHASKRHKPKTFVYRVHDRPDAEKIAKLAEYVRAFGYRLDLTAGNVTSSDLNALLEQVEGAPEQPVIEQAALRSMAKAVYSTKNIGHYGLAFDFYSHFTSPIRRYPDIIARRLLQRYLDNQPSVSAEEYEDMCKHCSETERFAIDAERDSIKYMQVKYMQQFKNKTFLGVISGVTDFGIFIEIIENKCEGMVRLSAIEEDRFDYVQEKYAIIGRRTKKRYQLGDEVFVKVKDTDLVKRNLDFELLGTKAEMEQKVRQ